MVPRTWMRTGACSWDSIFFQKEVAMNRSFLYGFLVAALLSIFWGPLWLKNSEAQTQAASYEGVMPFWTSGGWLGLFDQKAGIVYLYDDSLVNCRMIARINKLGLPMVVTGRGAK